MAIIGTFTLQADGKYTGKIHTLAVSAGVTFVPNSNQTSPEAPAFRAFTGKAEVGAAWQKTSESGNDYLSVKLDDPTFEAPLYAALVESNEGGYNLLWERRART